MNGAFQFYADLQQALKNLTVQNPQKLLVEVAFVQIKGYVNEESKLSAVTPDQIPEHMVKDQEVLVIDDIYDSGSLMDLVFKRINEIGVKSLNAAVLIHKRNLANRKYKFSAKYTGFTIPDKFVVGYGMDYNENGR